MRHRCIKQVIQQENKGKNFVSEWDQKKKVLMLASVASMIDQFNMPNIRMLLEMGYEVHTACNFKEGNTCDERQIRSLKKKLQQMQAVWHQWDCTRNIMNMKKCYTAYRQIRQILKDNRFEWIHCHSPIGGVLGRIAAHEEGIPVLYTAHGFHFYKGAPLKNWLFYYPIEKFLAHWTNVLVTVNKEDYKFAKKHLKAGQIYYIPGVGIDLERFGTNEKVSGNSVMNEERQQFCRKYCMPDNAVVLLSAGELNKGKNHAAVIRTLAQLSRQDVYYLICGQGILKEKLQKYADGLGVGAYVRMPGFQRNMPCIYRNADIFVFPSKREGMPAALMEAMAAGMPCAVSDIRGNRELIHHRFRFSLNKQQQLCSILKSLIESRKARYCCGMYNKQKVQQYDQKTVSMRMNRIYKKMGEIYADSIRYYVCVSGR